MRYSLQWEYNQWAAWRMWHHWVQSKQALTIKVSLSNFSLKAAVDHNRKGKNSCGFNFFNTSLWLSQQSYPCDTWVSECKLYKVFVLGLIHSRSLTCPPVVKCCRCRNAATGWLSANRLKPLLLTEGIKASPKLKSIQTCLSVLWETFLTGKHFYTDHQLSAAVQAICGWKSVQMK